MSQEEEIRKLTAALNQLTVAMSQLTALSGRMGPITAAATAGKTMEIGRLTKQLAKTYDDVWLFSDPRGPGVYTNRGSCPYESKVAFNYLRKCEQMNDMEYNQFRELFSYAKRVANPKYDEAWLGYLEEMDTLAKLKFGK